MDKNELESILNSNEKYSNEFTTKLLSDKEGCKKFIDDLNTYVKEHKPNCILFDDDVKICERGVTKINLTKALEEFRINARLSILSEKKRLLYIIREEELISTINKLQERLEAYDKFVSENSEEAVIREYSNQQLQEIAMIRSQSLPMYLVELETLSSATRDNENLYDVTTERAFMYASGIKLFLEESLNGSKD